MGWLRKAIIGTTAFFVGFVGSPFAFPILGTVGSAIVGVVVATTAVIAEHALSGGFSREKMKLKK